MINNISPTQKEFSQLLMGALLLAIGILGAFASVFFGMLFWAGAATYGTFLLVRAALNDFSNREGTRVTRSENGGFQYVRQFSRKFHYVSIPTATDVSVENHFRKLEVVDILAIVWITTLGAFQTTLGWMITDLTIPLLVWDSIGTTLVYLLLAFLFVAYFIFPAPHVVIKSPSISYAIPVNSGNTCWEAFRHLRSRGRWAWQGEKTRKILFLRCFFMLCCAIGAVIAALFSLLV